MLSVLHLAHETFLFPPRGVRLERPTRGGGLSIEVNGSPFQASSSRLRGDKRVHVRRIENSWPDRAHPLFDNRCCFAAVKPVQLHFQHFYPRASQAILVWRGACAPESFSVFK